MTRWASSRGLKWVHLILSDPSQSSKMKTASKDRPNKHCILDTTKDTWIMWTIKTGFGKRITMNMHIQVESNISNTTRLDLRQPLIGIPCLSNKTYTNDANLGKSSGRSQAGKLHWTRTLVDRSRTVVLGRENYTRSLSNRMKSQYRWYITRKIKESTDGHTHHIQKACSIKTASIHCQYSTTRIML